MDSLLSISRKIRGEEYNPSKTKPKVTTLDTSKTTKREIGPFPERFRKAVATFQNLEENGPISEMRQSSERFLQRFKAQPTETETYSNEEKWIEKYEQLLYQLESNGIEQL